MIRLVTISIIYMFTKLIFSIHFSILKTKLLVRKYNEYKHAKTLVIKQI